MAIRGKTVKNEKLVFRTALLAINVTVVLFITILIYWMTEQIRLDYNARTFLAGVTAIPWNPLLNIWRCEALLLLLTGSFVLRERVCRDNQRIVWGSLVADVLIGYLLIYWLDFNYTGILLMISANILFHLRDRRKAYLLIAVTVGGYLMMGYDLVSIHWKLYSLIEYIRYFDLRTQQICLIIFNVLNSLNIVMFAVYCIYIINQQRATIQEVNKLYSELEDVNAQLQEYAQMTEKMTQTRERNRLAREIHDTIGHVLTEIVMGLDACLTIIDLSPEKTKHQLEVISNVARTGIKDVRRSVSALRPDALERLNLKFAIQKMISDMTGLTDVKVYFSCEDIALKFDEDEEMAIYRVIQESITNAMRHGEAGTIWITIKQKDGVLKLQIRDNGKGCKEIKSGFGTKHIRERIGMLGGTVTFDGSDGFSVNAEIPIRWGETYD